MIDKKITQQTAAAIKKSQKEIEKLKKQEAQARKIGPDLYYFISLELDRDLFPGLKMAQDLLRRSLRSEKSESYIRLWERENRVSKFERVKLT